MMQKQGLAAERSRAAPPLSAMLGGFWFYAAAALVAAAAIIASLGGGAFSSDPGPQSGDRTAEGALVLGPRALSRGAVADFSHVMHTRRSTDAWTPDALRIAVLPDHGEPNAAETGVRILLSADDAQALAGRPVEVTLDTRSLNVTQAAALAVSLQNDGPIEWVTQPLPRDGGLLTFMLPATEGGPPTALGLRAVSDKADYNYGTEILSATLRPIAQ